MVVMLTECHGQTLNVRCVMRGRIKGPPQAVASAREDAAPPGLPSHLEFRPSFRRTEGISRHGCQREGGALLTACWQNGRISNYP